MDCNDVCSKLITFSVCLLCVLLLANSQVTVEYCMEGGACIPLRVHTIVISVQHSEDITLEEMRKQLKEKVIKVRQDLGI